MGLCRVKPAHKPFRFSISRCAPKQSLASLPLALRYSTLGGIGRALMRVVASLLAAKVNGRIARILVFGRRDFLGVRPILADEALQAGPRFDQRAGGGAMLVAGPAFLAREVIHFGEEQLGHLRRQNALVVLGKGAVVEAALGKFAVQEPKPEQIVTPLFAKEPVGAHAVKGDQHAAFEQLFGRHAGATFLGVKFIEQRRELPQNRIHTPLDGAQGMIGGHALVEVDDGQEVRLGLRFSTHVSLTRHAHICSSQVGLFQQPAKGPACVGDNQCAGGQLEEAAARSRF